MDDKGMTVGCVVMAAGSASRFGKNKLLAAAGEKTMIERALDAVPADALAAVCVVTRYPEIEALARRYGFSCVMNEHPEMGVSYTIRLGVGALAHRCGAILFQVADQPCLTRESVAALVERSREQPDRIVCLASGGVRGNPCVFPADLFPELCALEGDTGGSAVIRRHPERVLLLETDARELLDADTPEALKGITDKQ